MAQQYGKWKIVRPLQAGGQAHTYLVVDEGAEDSKYFVLKRLGTDRLDRARAELRAIDVRGIIAEKPAGEWIMREMTSRPKGCSA